MTLINPVIPAPAVTAASAYTATREERQQNLPIHQVVRATVAEGGEDRVLLEFAGRKVPTETLVPLKTGQQLDVMVMATSPRLELRILTEGLTERLGPLLHLLGEPLEILSVVRQFVASPSLLAGLSRASRTAFELWGAYIDKAENLADGQMLKAMMARLGLGHEGLLLRGDGASVAAGLKNALLEARQLLGEDQASLADSLDRLVQKLELLQLCRIRLDQQHLAFIPLPTFEQGYLIAERGAAAPGQEVAAVHKISLSLFLSGLGSLRVDLLQDGEGVHMRFACEDQEKADFVAQFKSELAESLEAVPVREILFGSGVEHPVRVLLGKLLPEGQGVVNTRV